MQNSFDNYIRTKNVIVDNLIQTCHFENNIDTINTHCIKIENHNVEVKY
jgi:hypothetical protein